MKKIYLLMLCAFLFSCKPTPDGGEEGGSTTNNDLREYVDLGLPSGTLWAAYNVGASSPEEFGNYYAWGEIMPKDEYTRENSLTYDKEMFNISGNEQYDAATANWGGDWRMPTYDELEELEDECDWIWSNKNDVMGYKVVGPNGNSIFLPLAGYRSGEGFYGAGRDAIYWSSEPWELHVYNDWWYGDTLIVDEICNSTEAYCIELNYEYAGCYDPVSRFYGYSVRPVMGGRFKGPENPEVPKVTTLDVNEITMISARCGCEVTFDGNLHIIAKGVCWSTKQNPTIEDDKTINYGMTYMSTMTNLEPNTTYYVRAYATNEVGTAYGEEKTFTTLGEVDGNNDVKEYVDLGLSVKWATCNVGATSPEEYGDYFAWGETTTKAEYTKENSLTYGKYFGDISGNMQYDAATANWGGDWRMPTEAELEELVDECTWTWTTQNGVNGYNVKGPNGNSIFLPAAGYRHGLSLYRNESYGYYWSSRPSPDYYNYDNSSAYYLELEGHFLDLCYFDLDRYYGQSVRPVLE